MKVGAENRTKLVIAAVLGAIALVFAVTRFSSFFGGGAPDGTTSAATRMPSASELSSQPPPTPKSNSRTRSAVKKPSGRSSLDPTLHLDLLKASEETKYEGTGRNIFRVFVEIPQPKAPVHTDTQQAQNQGPPPPPPPPPSNLKFYGFATSRPDGAKRIFLIKNEDVFIAAEGDIVDRRYKVVRISPNGVEILDVLSNNRENIPLAQG
ncbi:MAG: hypothetical protein DMG94_01470 [Acidobacteria bacterium]|nr:MAG: hypothetical protein DMG94_01470 [Acidobacteriota bacterium]